MYNNKYSSQLLEKAVTEIGRLPGIGSKTAVMNNNQIVSSVAAGVRQAVAEGMAIARGGEGGASPYEIHVTVKTQNDEVLARAVQRGQMRRNERFNTVAATQ